MTNREIRLWVKLTRKMIRLEGVLKVAAFILNNRWL